MLSPARVARRAATAPFGLVAAARGARAVHPQGFLCRGRWRITDEHAAAAGVPLLQRGADLEVLARPSRGAGLPERVGDFLAIAVRLVDAHGPGRPQDLLMNTTLDLPVAHHLFLPAPRWYAQSYSTCLPYTTDAGATLLVGLLPPDEAGPGPSVDAMRRAVAEGTTFRIALATPLRRFAPIGELRLDEVVGPDAGDVDFEPLVNCGGGLHPAPAWLQRIRSEAYLRSRRGRHGPVTPRTRPTA